MHTLAHPKPKSLPVFKDAWSAGSAWRKWTQQGGEYAYYQRYGIHAAALEWQGRRKRGDNGLPRVMTVEHWQKWICESLDDPVGCAMAFHWRARA